LRRALTTVGLVIAGFVCGTSAAFAAPAHHTFSIPAQSTAGALNSFARQSGLQLIFSYDAATHSMSRRVFGTMADARALKLVLAGTNFTYDASLDGVVTVSVKHTETSENMARVEGEDAVPLEVIITGTKRNDLDKNLAASVAVATGKQLDQSGANGFSDYLNSVPGVSFSAAIPGLSTVSIRGVSTTTWIDQGQGTTGYYINDVPMTDPYFSVAVPDIDIFDVANVTILRGPQGTLFGSGALGGAINYLVTRPNLMTYEARTQIQALSVDGKGKALSERAMVNLPLIPDRLAVRLVLVDRHDPGYINNVGLGRDNSNSSALWGGRFLVTFRPTDRTRLNYFYLKQTQKTADAGFDDLSIGAYRKSTHISDAYSFITTVHNLRVDQDLDFATLTATLTQHQKGQSTLADATGYFTDALPNLVSPVYAKQIAESNGTTFEARLASKGAGKIDYVVGVFYDRTSEYFDSRYGAAGADSAIEALYAAQYGSGIGRLGTVDNGQTFYYGLLNFLGQEAALFGEVGYRINPEWKFLLGWRAFETRTQIWSETSGFLATKLLGDADVVTSGHQGEHGLLPKVSLTWTPSRHTMLYALISNGFRFGGNNINPATSSDQVPSTFGSDTTINYEIGGRGDLWKGRLQYEVTAFYIDWSNIQTRYLNDAGVAYAVNAGRARNYGVEAVITAHPVPALTLQANLTYLDARLVNNVVLAGDLVRKGTTLPGANRWSVASTIGYQWHALTYQPMIAVSYRGRSSVRSSLSAVGEQGGYDLFGLRASWQLSEAVKFTVSLDNATNARAVTNTDVVNSIVHSYVVRPRTFGLTMDASF
jgi:iron complex outermembrane receptor protein